MNRLITPAERTSLAELITEVEAQTAGEIVTVVLKRSSSYSAYRVGWAAALAVLLAALIHLAWPLMPAMELLGAQALLFLFAHWTLGHAAILRLIVPRRIQHQATHRRAQRLFLECGVVETRDRSGVLIVLSELEHRVEIMGDRGIHEQLGAAAWQALVEHLVGSIRRGRVVDGLRSVIEKLGQELSAKFPPRPDDTNELANHVIVEES